MADLMADIEGMKKAMTVKDEEITELKKAMTDKDEKIKKLTEENDALKEALKVATANFMDYGDTNIRLGLKIERLEAELAAYKSKSSKS